MPPKGRPSSSHSSRPVSSGSPRAPHNTPHSPHTPNPHRSASPHSGFGGSPPPAHPHPHHRHHPVASEPVGVSRSGYGIGYRNKGGGCIAGCTCFVVLLLLISVIVGLVMYGVKNKRTSQQTEQSYSENSEEHIPIYVAALDRDVPWSMEYQMYYDKQTNCYFFQNYDLDPPIWQYWFASIAADYGDYGWLEWDETEQRWYVESAEGQWEPLPEEKAAGLWHFD